MKCAHCGVEFKPTRSNSRFHSRACYKAFYAARPYKRTHAAELLANAKARAKKKGIPFTITADDFVVPEFCPILGIRLERGVGAKNYIETSPSLDRIRPAEGYVPGNVAVISMRANRIKNDATAEELRSVLKYIEEN